MKELLEDVLHVLNALPDRKLRGKDWTTYDLAKRVEEELKFQKVVFEISQATKTKYRNEQS